jgi:hypothetical protein
MVFSLAEGFRLNAKETEKSTRPMLFQVLNFMMKGYDFIY